MGYAFMGKAHSSQVMRLISGGWTEDFLSRLHFQTAFISSAGLSLERGLTTTTGPRSSGAMPTLPGATSARW